MVNEVNKLIYNTLLDAGAIYIPELGTICISCTTARKMFRGRVASPTYSTSFTTAHIAASLTDTIATGANIDMADAEDITRRWLKKSTADGRVVIEGVGTISGGNFVADKELVAALEQTSKIITLTKGKSSNLFAWVASIVTLLCIGGGVGAYIMLSGNDNTSETSDLVAVNNALETTNITDADIEAKANAENETDTTLEQAQTAEAPNVTDVVTEPKDEKVVEENATPQTEIEEKAEEPTIEEVAEEAINEQTTPIDNTATEAAITDWRYASVRHYVIYGSYSVPSNANSAIRKIMRKNPAAQCKIIKLGNMHAVAVYGSYNRRDCEVFKRNHRSLYRNAWIHTPKRFK